ncbi:hypothetical protein HCN44_004748 [Aphidius gifuensis]|uniref:Uncharacterized protein n=1 Tax=Aphidius gifuensis TaxID=684658 RepID=A0A834XYN5_APHGI|nr:uncharacterized protein LOC122849055 [Aphidius gifuensis]KAF7995276.1 hypothetical protein HCN44_004748 [Aphidius gifuensis]
MNSKIFMLAVGLAVFALLGSIEGMPQPADSGAALATTKSDSAATPSATTKSDSNATTLAPTKSGSDATTTATPAEEPSKFWTFIKWTVGILILVAVLVGVGYALIKFKVIKC